MSNLIRYKVLRDDLTSPLRDYTYELNHWYEEPRIGQPGDNDCQIGLYCGAVEGLLHQRPRRPGESVYRCEVKGRQAGEPPSKECWERMRILNRLTDQQVRTLARRHHKRLGYLLEECLYPVASLKIERGVVTEQEIELLRQWVSVKEPAMLSVWASVGEAVKQPLDRLIGHLVDHLVKYSAREINWGLPCAYIGSLFPNIKKWKYVDHQPGMYPFQAGADLWRAGLVPSQDGTTWALHSGPNAAIIWSGTV